MTLNTLSTSTSITNQVQQTSDVIALMQESISLDFVLSNAQLHFTPTSLSQLTASSVNRVDHSAFISNSSTNVFNKSLNLYLLNISLNAKSNELNYTFFKFFFSNPFFAKSNFF